MEKRAQVLAHIMAALKGRSPALRRWSLRRNARDPLQHKWLNRIVNSDLRRGFAEQQSSSPIRLWHSAGLDSNSAWAKLFPNRRSSAMRMADSDVLYMPSLGLGRTSHTGEYGVGYSRAAGDIPVNFYFGPRTLRDPRVDIYGSNDAFTLSTGGFIKRLGEKVSDPAARRDAYADFRRGYFTGASTHAFLRNPSVTVQDALDTVRRRVKHDTLEVKPYRDVLPSEIKAVEINLGSLGDKLNGADPSSLGEVANFERALGNRGIPYYFTYGHRGNPTGLPSYVMSSESMLPRFTPGID